ncbi:hypothetical protein Tco_0128102 [Tanacetum coccineum]
MDDPNITLEEYIRLKEEKAQKHGKVFNQETARYGKIWYAEDVHNLRSVETEFPAIVFNDSLTTNETFSCEPLVNDLKSDKGNDHNEIDMIQSSGDMAPLPPREQRYPFLRYQGLEYSDQDITNFKDKLERIHDRGTHRVQSESERMILGKGDLRDYWRDISTDGDFLGPPPSYTLIRDPVLRLCHRMMAHSIAGRSQASEKVTVIDLFYLRGLDVGSVNISYLLARYLRRFGAGRKSEALISGGQFVLAGPARQEGDAGGVAEEALVAPEGSDEDEEMPQVVPPPPRTQGERIARLEKELHGMRKALQGQRKVLDSMDRDFSRFTTWTVTSLTRLMAGVHYMRYSKSPVEYQRRTRQRTDNTSTSTAPHQPNL